MFTSPLWLWSLHPGLGEALWPGLPGISPTGPLKGAATNGETRLEEGLAVRVRPQSLGFLIQKLHPRETFPSGASHFLKLKNIVFLCIRGFNGHVTNQGQPRPPHV